MLEVGRMAMYMTIPVALYHYFNQPENFEEFVIEKKREMFPRQSDADIEAMEDIARAYNEKQRQKELSAYKKSEESSKKQSAVTKSQSSVQLQS